MVGDDEQMTFYLQPRTSGESLRLAVYPTVDEAMRAEQTMDRAAS
jgi:hypothetical protein